MDQRFKDWIIKHHEKLEPVDKSRFLALLKSASDENWLRFISQAQCSWAIEAFERMEDQPFTQDLVADPPEILKVLKEHFLQEAASTT